MASLTTILILVLIGVGTLVLFLGLVSDWLKRVGIPAPLLALLAGIIAGPMVLNIVDPANWGNQAAVLKNAARLTISVSLMAAALRLPQGYLRSTWRDTGIMLGPVMVLMWLSSSLLVFLVLGESLLTALLVGAVLTPTDPVIAAGVASGRFARQHLPSRIRDLLTVEAGANDGMAYPFVFLPLLLLTRPTGQAWQTWLTQILLQEVLLALVLGLFLGYISGWLLRKAIDNHTIEKPNFLAYGLALALLTLGAVRLIGSDGILAVFVAGLAFKRWLTTSEKSQAKLSLETEEPFLTLPIFGLIGLALPFSAWLELGWPALLLVILILLLRRLPALLLMAPFLEEVEKPVDAFFVGWFGPIGVGALFYASLSLEQNLSSAWAVGSLMIVGSVLIHGLTATPFSRWYCEYTSYSPPAKERAQKEKRGQKDTQS